MELLTRNLLSRNYPEGLQELGGGLNKGLNLCFKDFSEEKTMALLKHQTGLWSSTSYKF